MCPHTKPSPRDSFVGKDRIRPAVRREPKGRRPRRWAVSDARRDDTSLGPSPDELGRLDAACDRVGRVAKQRLQRHVENGRRFKSDETGESAGGTPTTTS
jgi:hypothetical protein